MVEGEKEKNVWVRVCRKCRTEYPNHTEECRDNHKNEEIIGTHTAGGNSCGGNIIRKGNCSWCDKCGEFFCGCASG